MKKEKKYLFKITKLTSLSLFFLLSIAKLSFAINLQINTTENQPTKELKIVDNSTSTEEKEHFKFINGCDINDQIRNQIIEIIEKNNNLSELPECLRLDRRLIFKLILINSKHFKNIDPSLKKDSIFIYRIAKINPEIIPLIDEELLKNSDFISKISYSYRDALKYSHPSLKDDLAFISQMIKKDSRNYIYASERLKSNKELAILAFEDNPLLLADAPDSIKKNKEIAELAIKINPNAFKFIDSKLKEDNNLIKLAEMNDYSDLSQTHSTKINQFIESNYITTNQTANQAKQIYNQGKFFAKNKIINRPFVVKWQKFSNSINENQYNLKLINVKERNNRKKWAKDFLKHPELIQKINSFFINRNIDQSTIDNLVTTYLWKFNIEKQTVMAFNLYNLKESNNNNIYSKERNDFANITSFTAIATFNAGKWSLTVVDAILDNDIKTDISYREGHKKYILWDLYQFNENDKNLKLIFKIEDRFNEYFEIFSANQNNENLSKYQMIHRFNPLFDKDTDNK